MIAGMSSGCFGLCRPRTYERLYNHGTDAEFSTYLVSHPDPEKLRAACAFLERCIKQALKLGDSRLVVRNIDTLKHLVSDCRSCGREHAVQPLAWRCIDLLLTDENPDCVTLGADLLVDCLAATADDHRSNFSQFVPIVISLCRRAAPLDSDAAAFPVQFTGYALLLHLANTLVRRPERLERYAEELAEVLHEGMRQAPEEVPDDAAEGLAGGAAGGVPQEIIIVGACCTLAGLQARPDLNGRRVTVRELNGERFLCSLDDGEVLKVREGNLQRPRAIGGGDAWGAGVEPGDKAVPVLAWRTLRRLVSVPCAPTASSLLNAFFKLFDSLQWSSDRLILEVLMTATEHSSVHLPVTHLLFAHAGSVANSHVSLTGMVTRYSGPTGAGAALHPPPVVMGSELSIVKRDQRVGVLEKCLRVAGWLAQMLRPLSKGRKVGRLGGETGAAIDAPCYYRLTDSPQPNPAIRPLRPLGPHACVFINPTFLSDLVSLLAVLEWCADVYPHECMPFDELPLPTSDDGLLSVASLDAWALAHECGVMAAQYGGDVEAFSNPSLAVSASASASASAAPLDGSMSTKSSASAKQLRALLGQRVCGVIAQCLRCLSLLCRDEMPTGPGLGTILPTVLSYLSETTIALPSSTSVLKRALILQAMNAILSVQRERLTGVQGATWGGGLTPVRPVNDFALCELAGLLQSKDWHVVRQVCYFFCSLLHKRATMGSRAFVLASVGLSRSDARYAPMTLGQTIVLRDALFNALCAPPPSPLVQALVSAACWHVHTALLLAYGPAELLHALPMVLALEDSWTERTEALAKVPAATPAAPAPIVVGACCTLSGLQARPDLNGRRVTVQEYQGERWLCSLDDGEVLKVREVNLCADVLEEGSSGGLAFSSSNDSSTAERHAMGCQRLYFLVFFVAAAKSFDGPALLASLQELHKQWKEAGALPSHLDMDPDRFELVPMDASGAADLGPLGTKEVGGRVNRRDLLVGLLQCGRLKSEAAHLRAAFSTPYLPCDSPRQRLAQLSSSSLPHPQFSERAADRFATPARPPASSVNETEPLPPPPASIGGAKITTVPDAATAVESANASDLYYASLVNAGEWEEGQWQWQGQGGREEREERKEDEDEAEEEEEGGGGGEVESGTLSDMLGYTGFANWGVKVDKENAREHDDPPGSSPSPHSPHWRERYLESKRSLQTSGGFADGVGSTDRPSDPASGKSSPSDLSNFSLYLGNSPTRS